jgi:hypothetical protein
VERRETRSPISSQVSEVGSIPIARSIKHVDAVGFAGFPPQNTSLKCSILYAIGRERMVPAVRDAPSTPIPVPPNNTPTTIDALGFWRYIPLEELEVEFTNEFGAWWEV